MGIRAASWLAFHLVERSRSPEQMQFMEAIYMMDRKKQRNVRGALRGVVALLLCLTLLAGGAFAKTVRGDLSDRFEEPPTLEKDGQTYQYRRGLETILFMGIDTRLQYDDERSGFRNGGQSDFLLLLVIDEENETITPIPHQPRCDDGDHHPRRARRGSGHGQDPALPLPRLWRWQGTELRIHLRSGQEPLPGHRHRLLRVHEHGRHL